MKAATPSQTSPETGLPGNKANTPLGQKERQLPWQIQTALSRLRHDLQMLPIYKFSSQEEIRRIKLQVIGDVIRPMGAPELLKDFLVNCDLVARDLAVLEESEIEREIVRDLSKEMLVATAREIVKDLEQLSAIHGSTQGEGASDEIGRCLFVLREITRRLYSLGSAIEPNLLQWLLKHQVLSLDDLPSDIRYAAETAQLTDTFLARKDEYTERLAHIAADGSGRHLTAFVSRILPELLRRREYQTVTKILAMVKKGRGTSRLLEELEGLLSQAISNADMISHLLKDINCQDKEQRNHLVEILAFIGAQAVPGLLATYANTGAKSIRVTIFEVIRRIGESSLQAFLARLPQLEPDWFVIFHILETLGQQGDVSLAEPISCFLRHSNAHIRQGALTALFRLQGAAAESYFLQALGDREGAVRQMAVTYLGRIHSLHPEALEFYLRAFHVADPSVPPENEGALAEVCKALASSENLSVDYITRAENTLLAALRTSEHKRFHNWFKKPHSEHSERLRIAICNALAAIGTSAAVGRLHKIAAIESGAVAENAASAAKQIEERLPPYPTEKQKATG